MSSKADVLFSADLLARSLLGYLDRSDESVCAFFRMPSEMILLSFFPSFSLSIAKNQLRKPFPDGMLGRKTGF